MNFNLHCLIFLICRPDVADGASANMPAMTMTFPLKDSNDLTTHKAGDTIQFQIGQDGGVVKIIHVRAAKN